MESIAFPIFLIILWRNLEIIDSRFRVYGKRKFERYKSVEWVWEVVWKGSAMGKTEKTWEWA